MKPGIRYIVTRDSENQEFQIGDRITLYPDGSIGNRAACGWMPAKDVPEATRGMLYEIDAKWAANRRAELDAELADLSTIRSTKP